MTEQEVRLMRRQKRPCAECPWRRDVPPGQFPLERFEALRATAGEGDGLAAIEAPMFGCHKAAEGDDGFACAGWLVVCGRDHVGIRVAVAGGQLPADALDPGDDWPMLFSSYGEMAENQGRAS